MSYLYELSLFGFKTLIIVIGVALVIIIPLVISQKANPKEAFQKKLKLENMQEKLNRYVLQAKEETISKKEFKNYIKKIKKEEKNASKKKGRSFVLTFAGDVMATQVENLRDEITLLLQLVTKNDEVVLLLESRGGSVAHYGLAASQLQRLRDRNISLTICIDRIAASGGYLMACVGSKILSAPFAYVGSIGVIFTTPNLSRLLKKHDVDYQEVTAGKYKRTVTTFGEITDEKKKRLKEQLDTIHVQFKNFLKQYRPNLDLEKIATGEVWLGLEAKNLGLVDEIACSDDHLMDSLKERDVYKVSLKAKKPFLKKLFKKLESQKEALSTNEWII